MRHLNVPVVLFHVFESLQVEGEDHGQLLYTHPLLRFLVAATVITFKFVLAAQRFSVTANK